MRGAPGACLPRWSETDRPAVLHQLCCVDLRGRRRKTKGRREIEKARKMAGFHFLVCRLAYHLVSLPDLMQVVQTRIRLVFPPGAAACTGGRFGFQLPFVTLCACEILLPNC